MPQFGITGQSKDALSYADYRVSVIPTFDFNRAPTTADRNYPIQSIARDKNTLNEYILVDVSGGLADWRLFTGGGGGGDVVDFGVDSGPVVVPDINGRVFVTGSQTASGTISNFVQSDGNTINTITIQCQRASAEPAETVSMNGISHFNSADFTVSNGFVSLDGGVISEINVDAHTAPGTDPVVGTNGQITVTGGQVAAGTVGANVIQTNSLAANTYTIQIQRADAVAALDTTKNGVSHFNNAQFTVSSGFVSLIGGTTAVISFNVDANTAPGTDPVLADAVTGQVTVTGGQVAAGTVGANVIRTDSLAANTYTIEIQRADVAAAANSEKNGVSHFSSVHFDIAATGFVELDNIVPLSFPTDSGTATAAVHALTIAGGTGIDTSGAGSTVTVAVDVTELPTLATTYAADSGTATPAANILTLAGGTNGIDTVAAGSTVTFNFDVTEQPTIATTYTCDAGSAVPAANNLNIIGAGGITTSGSGSTVTITASGSGGNPTTFLQIQDDFLLYILGLDAIDLYSELTWFVTQNGWTSTHTPVSGHPGVITNSTLSSSTAYIFGYSTPTSQIPPIVLGGGVMTITWIFKITTLSTGVNRYTISAGLGDVSSPDQDNGTYVKYSDNLNSGNWQYITANATVRTTTNSSTAVTAAWHNLTITINAAASSVSYTIDGVSLGTAISTNIPTTNISPFFVVRNTVGTTAASNIQLDLFYMTQSFTTPR